MNESWSFLIIYLVVIIVLYNSIRIAKEDERFAVFVLGRFAGFKGPGLVIMATGVQQLHRLKVGDLGVLTSSEFAKFGKADIPISNKNSLGTGQAVRIDGFDGTELRIVASSKRASTHCPNCGHQF